MSVVARPRTARFNALIRAELLTFAGIFVSRASDRKDSQLTMDVIKRGLKAIGQFVWLCTLHIIPTSALRKRSDHNYTA
jgi:hypothetical protein